MASLRARAAVRACTPSMAKRWIVRTNKHNSWLMQPSCGVRCAVVQAVSADRTDAQSCADALHNNDQTLVRSRLRYAGTAPDGAEMTSMQHR